MAREASDKGRQIGARIAEARHEAGGMSQRELGELCGVTERSVQAWESGTVIPYRYLRDLESATGKPAAWFLHGEEAIQGRDDGVKEILEAIAALGKKVDALAKRLPR